MSKNILTSKLLLLIVFSTLLTLLSNSNAFAQSTKTIYQDQFNGTINVDVPDAIQSQCNNCKYQNFGGTQAGSAYFYLNHKDAITGLMFDRSLSSTLINGVNYNFSIYYKNSFSPSPSNYTFTMRNGTAGAILGSVTKTDFATNTWKQATFSFVGGASSNVQLSTTSPGSPGGNDNGFDTLMITHLGPTVAISNTAICPSMSTTLSSILTGSPSHFSSPVYQWQQSTDGGTTWTNISGATSSSYILSGLSSAFNSRRYRLLVAQNAAAMASSAHQFISNVINLGTITCSGITITKVSNSGTGTFGFSGNNGFGTDSIITSTAGTAVTGTYKALTNAGTATTITETFPATGAWQVTNISCSGLGSGGTATPDLPNRTVVLNAAATAAGSNISCTFTNGIPDLTIIKSHSGNFMVGSDGNYSFTVSNIGSASTSGTITVTDTLPTGLTVNGGAAGGITEGGTNAANWTCNSNAATPQVITCTSTTAIAASGSSVFNFAVNVGLGTAVGVNSITNTATVSGGGETNTTNNSSSDPTTVIGLSPLSPINTNPVGCAIPVADRVSSADFPASGAYISGGSYPFTSTVTGYSNSVTYTRVFGTFDPVSPAFPRTYVNTGSTYSLVAGPLRTTTHEYTDFNFVGASGIDGIVRYDFATPLTSSDGILIWDIDNGENVEIRFYDSSNNLLTTTSWTGQLISGSGGAVPGVGTNAIYFDGRSTGNAPDPIYLLIPPIGQSVARIEVTQTDPSADGSYDFAFVHGDCQKDYGDAPATYNAGNPARHSVPATPTVYLGSVAPDYEASERTPLDGTGDDVSGSDDESGVSTFPVLTVAAGATYSVTVNVTTSGTSYLQGFIDFNRDGDFADTGESSATLAVSASGDQTLSFTTPAGMTVGVTYARFRLSSTSSEVTSPTGAATNGEVEDYQLTIVNPPTIVLQKSVLPTGNQPPGTDLSYSINFTNTGGSVAQQFVLTDAIPIFTDFKVGSVVIDPGTTGMTIVAEYSNDYDSSAPASATWTYTPASEGGGASSGYDRNVKAIRWRVTTGDLSNISPNNTGSAGFTVIIR
jgi:uncharacterized repeat protein (TIGR01451 family)